MPYDENIVSDLHKDAFGFRPGEAWWREWRLSTDEGRQEIWDGLLVSLEAAVEEERARQQRCIAEFEMRVARVLCMGAGNREQAIRWIMNSDDCDDMEELCYRNGLPFRYFV